MADVGPSGKRRSGQRALIWALSLLATVSVIVAVIVFPKAAPTQQPSRTASKPTYPISGFFVTASGSASTNRQKLADIKAVGGDTAITFGTLVRPVSRDELPVDCLIDGKNCAEAVAGDATVKRYFIYSDGTHWDEAALKCPKDRTLKSDGKLYTVFLLPTQGTDCVSPNGEYELVVAGGTSATADDPSASLAAAASELDMKFYMGMPAPVKRSDLDYLPDLSYQRTLSLFTERFLLHQASANDVEGLAGFYHHVEMPVSDSPFFDPILALYEMQNKAIRKALPSRSAIVSPYIESRVNAANVSPENAKNGMRKIAQTASGLVLNIAIQDGMGTGKGAAYFKSDAASSVDPFAASIVGNGSWGDKYVAPNSEYFSAAAAGVSGTDAVLWANLEGMAPATDSNQCGDSLRGQTTLARMDRQLQQMAVARKVISFMWDSYFTCVGTGTPLKVQLESGFTSPVITDTEFDPAAGQVLIRGFNLVGGTAKIRWTLRNGEVEEKKAEPSSSDVAYGQDRDLHPRLEMISVDVGATTLDPREYYTVRVTNGWGVENEIPYSERG